MLFTTVIIAIVNGTLIVGELDHQNYNTYYVKPCFTNQILKEKINKSDIIKITTKTCSEVLK